MDAPTTQPPPPQDQPPLLQYAALPPGIGLIVEPLPDGIRITKPPVRAYAYLLLVFLLLISPVGLLFIALATDHHALKLPIRIVRSAFKPRIFEVNATTLSLLNIDINGRPEDFIRPRQD